MLVSTKRGGARPGSGPKVTAEKSLVKAEADATEAASIAKLAKGFRKGIAELDHRFPEIVHTAISLALGRDPDIPDDPASGKPDGQMVRVLLNFGLQVASEEDSDKSPMGELMKTVRNLSFSVTYNSGTGVDSDSEGNAGEAEHTTFS